MTSAPKPRDHRGRTVSKDCCWLEGDVFHIDVRAFLAFYDEPATPENLERAMGLLGNWVDDYALELMEQVLVLGAEDPFNVMGRSRWRLR